MSHYNALSTSYILILLCIHATDIANLNRKQQQPTDRSVWFDLERAKAIVRYSFICETGLKPQLCVCASFWWLSDCRDKRNYRRHFSFFPERQQHCRKKKSIHKICAAFLGQFQWKIITNRVDRTLPDTILFLSDDSNQMRSFLINVSVIILHAAHSIAISRLFSVGNKRMRRHENVGPVQTVFYTSTINKND